MSILHGTERLFFFESLLTDEESGWFFEHIIQASSPHSMEDDEIMDLAYEYGMKNIMQYLSEMESQRLAYGLNLPSQRVAQIDYSLYDEYEDEY